MRKLILFVAVATMIFACKNEKAEGGYKVVHHVKKGGKTPQPTDYAYCDIYQRIGTEVINSTKMQGEPTPVPMPELLKEGDKGKANPIVAGLRLMAVGDSITVFMPIDTVKNKPEKYKDAKMMEFDIVLRSIKTADEFKADREAKMKEMQEKAEKGKLRAVELTTQVGDIAKQFKAGKLAAQLKTTASGLKYMITEPGSGAKVESGNNVSVNYYGCLPDGKVFDNSFERGQLFDLQVGQGMVIPGWDEGLQLFNEGAKGYLFIPAALGYGDKGAGKSIPPKSDLIFYVEIEKVKK
ncbi:MAG: hypothetical protein RLZZ292_2070 [Bacteroidota bacterium]|jgi:FKBP-type peptidyl-prolyl cis-trans isomerase